MKLLYLGKLLRPKITNSALNCWFSQCYNTMASLGRTDVEDKLHALKPEELCTDTPAWCCSTTTQDNTSISQCQCRCRSSHPGCKSTTRQKVRTPGSYAGQNTCAADVRQESSPSIHWRRDFSCSAENETSDSPKLRQHPCEIPQEPGPQSSHLVIQILLSWLPIPSRRSAKRPRW